MKQIKCFHCSDYCGENKIIYQDKPFCCNGCKTVYDIFSQNDLLSYYNFQESPGTTPKDVKGKYDFLDQKEIVNKLIEFDDGHTQAVTLHIPSIHCSSCIWVLENLNKLDHNILSSQVFFERKTVYVVYSSSSYTLKQLILLLNSVGYAPYISLKDYDKKKKKQIDRSLIYKLGVSGFAFGNVMLLSFPEYFEVSEFWLDKYKPLFHWLIFLFSLPVVLYSSQEYFISAYKGIKSKILNIDVPITLGIVTLFFRSVVDMFFSTGPGFFDSLTGLVFFLLVGKFFQQKTYAFLSFDRDYKSYFPIAATRILSDGTEEIVQIYKIKKGDRLLIRNGELIPVDSILIKGSGVIDYSFVTGESSTTNKSSGDQLFSGGKQTAGMIEISVIKPVKQSRLTQLWSQEIFNIKNKTEILTLTNLIGKYFTSIILIIAFGAALFWFFKDSSKMINVFTAILIIACPCAIALSAPFTFGSILRSFGRLKFFLKNSKVIEQLAKIDVIIFDKTGTITSSEDSTATYEGEILSFEEKALLKSILHNSNHPLSRILYKTLEGKHTLEIDYFKEYLGKGIKASYQNHIIKIGSADFVRHEEHNEELKTSVHISIDDSYKGKYTFKNTYRDGMSDLFPKLQKDYEIEILSGDNEGERSHLKKMLPPKTLLFFNQSPKDKLEHIKHLQNQGKRILMIGDGLNDSGALAQSDVGIAVSENTATFSPSCDAILEASMLCSIGWYLRISKSAIQIVKYSFLLSFLYNIVGLYFAITGQLTPVLSAILMPLSATSIVFLTTLSSHYLVKLSNQ